MVYEYSYWYTSTKYNLGVFTVGFFLRCGAVRCDLAAPHRYDFAFN